MITLEISENDGNQRLDRFLRKYYAKCSLGGIYKMVRKDIKVNGKRASAETMLRAGDQVQVYLPAEEAEKLRRTSDPPKAKRQFSVSYEDEHILAVSKPFGLLTHGDISEKKNTLANQVIGYLIEKGDYIPRVEKTFVPSPVNRLDRNTTGLVLFGKDARTLKELNRKFRERDQVGKFYMTIVSGRIKSPMTLEGALVKDRDLNRVRLLGEEMDQAKDGETRAKDVSCLVTPLAYGKTKPDSKGITRSFTLVEVKLLTGRSHQIRIQLADAGYPIIGDVKYGDPAVNRMVASRFGQTTQLLHAARLIIDGKEITAELPEGFQRIAGELFYDNTKRR